MSERLLAVAHGTDSPAGSATTAALLRAVAAARPAVPVDLCFLDVVSPRLSDVLDDRPTIVVPVLLSTGYHVQTDIPQALSAHPHAHRARHLGPHPLLVDALVDRLGDVTAGSSLVLAGSGSSRPEARAELDETADLLGARLGRDVTVVTVSDPALGDRLAALPAPLQVASYLLADGQFVRRLHEAVGGRGTVSAPIGVHPALVELVWQRYDKVAAPTR